MRKQVLAALAVVAIGTLCASQVEAQSKSIGLGLRGGLNLSTVSASPAPSPPEEISSKTGFHAGVVVALDLHEYFGIEIDGLYTQQGFTDTELEPGVDGKLHGAYIQVPIMAKGRYPVGSSVAIRIMGGPAIEFEVGCTISLTAGEIEGSLDCDHPLLDAADRKKTLWSLMFGGGLGINAGPATVFLDVLYDLGLTNLVENPAPDESVKSRTWMFSAGFSYPVAILQ